MKRIRMALCLLLCLTVLSSCGVQTASIPTATLPPVSPGPAAPYGDAALRYPSTVTLYLPSLDGQTLLAFYDTLTLTYGEHPAEEILRALLSHEGNARVSSIGGSTELTLAGSDPVILSGSVCTVNLSASALLLSSQDFHTAAQAIAATLCELDDIDYVNLLVAGTPVAMDVGGNLPLGALAGSPGQELTVLWQQLTAKRTPVGELAASTPLTAAAALYFPLADGSGVAAEPRRLSFTGQHPQQLMTALLEALSSGAAILSNTADMPDVMSLMLFMPEVVELEGGGRRATLHFTADVLDRLALSGCDPVCFFASLTMTLTSFVPSLQQVCFLSGNGALTTVTSPVHGARLFPGALHMRSHYANLVMGQGTLYIPADTGLTARTISLPHRSTLSPRTLLLRLSECGALPQGLTDADILGISVHDGTLLINLSDRYSERLRTAPDQRLAAYSVVTTLCQPLELHRVRFYFSGSAVDSLGSDLTWSGEFMYRPGMAE